MNNIYIYKYGYYILVFILLLPLMILRDFDPMNELRYISIANEALDNNHLFSFYNQGEVYADKPPLYFWIVMIGKTLFGSHQIWFLSLFSIIPAFVIMRILDKWTIYLIDDKYRFAVKMMLVSSTFFLGAIVVLRMDMLMTMFIVLSLFTFFHIYSKKGSRFDRWLLPFYIFMAIFTKGPMGLLIPTLSIAIFLLIKGEIRYIGQYLGFRAWGVILFFCSVWFTCVWLESGSEYIYNLLFKQTINRAVDSFHHKGPLYYYILRFWYILAPWSIIFFISISLGIKKRLIRTDIEYFFLTTIIVSFILLSIISSKLEIYMLPILPFIAYLSVIILSRLNDNKWIRNILILLSCIFILALPAYLLMNRKISVDWLIEIDLIVIFALSSLFAGGILSLYFIYKRSCITKSISCISIALLTLICVSSFGIPTLNNYISYGELSKKGIALAGNKSNYLTYGIKRSENMDVYLGKSVLKATPEEILSNNNNGSILFCTKKAIEENQLLDNFIKRKKVYPIGSFLVVQL